MKKILLLIMIVLSITLTGCKKTEIVDETEKYEIPKETAINKQELAYSSYLKLSNPEITITIKDMGDIVLQLFPDIAPNTVNNIIAYANRGDYVDNDFHRVMIDFMIQGGRLASPSCSIQGEMNNNPDFNGDNDLPHYRGVISMARVGGDYNSNSSQFFIVHADSFFLDNEYATFGAVVSGFNILDFIANMNDGVSQVPSETVYIENITVELNGYVTLPAICE